MGEAVLYDVDNKETDVFLYGHKHITDNLEEESGIIAELLERSDVAAIEHLGLRKWQEKGTENSFSKDNYPGNLMNMVEDAGIETVYGPDSKTGLIHYTFGLFMPIAFLYGIAAKRGYEWIQQNKEGIDSLELSEVNPPVDEISDINMSRREFLTGAATGTGMYSAGFFDPFQPDDLEQSADKLKYPISINYNDMREVYIAEGISQIAEEPGIEDITGIFGHAHSDSIKNYLEEPKSRQYKIEWYSNLLPEYQEQMTKWINGEEVWRIDEVTDLSQN